MTEQPPLVAQRLSYSSLADYGRCGYRFYLRRVLRLPDRSAPPRPGAPAAADGLDPLTRGSIVHRLLERIDLRAPAPPTEGQLEQAARACGASPTEAERDEMAVLVARFLASPLAARLAAASRLQTEAPFAFALDPGPAGTIVHGVVDVLAAEKSHRLVVDYKSDRLGAAAPHDLVGREYVTQRLVYGLAALHDGAGSVEVAHCFLERPDEPVIARYEARDLPALREQVHALADGALGGHFPVTDSPHYDLCSTCPGRAALCSHPPERTLQVLAGTFSGSGGPS